MSRIPYPEIDALSDDNKAFLEKLAPLNLFRMLSHAPHLLKPFVGLGTAFLQQGKLDPVTRECVILRVGYLSNAKYETTQHEAIGLAVGMDEELIAAVKAGPHADGLSHEQKLALTFTDHLVTHPHPSDGALKPVLKHFGTPLLEELVLLIGYYMMVCRFLETFGVEVEEGGPKGAEITRP
ncbi:carboxymuconolactone decarboxylase family protein [Hyphomonas sp.]|uniref:carboxymuconolactone decarboxylase family protein n=1 Tax=Hyphomonas sp. TaxID=87 RepID=UPI003001C6B6